MRYPFGLVIDSAKHIAARKLRGQKRFALMMSLDPLGACSSNCLGKSAGNGASAAQGRIAPLTVEQCLAAIEECGAPVVTICGGEPLEYEEIPRLTREILARGKHLFICTDGSLIRRRLHMIPPEMNFFWNVKLDGTQAVHDARAARPGLLVEALDGVKAAKNAGFFVVVSTTVYPDTDLQDVAALYDRLHAMHVDGYVLSPSFPAKPVGCEESKAFRGKMRERFQEASRLLGQYNLLTSPLYLEYLRGERDLDCAAWASPVYSPGGWARPCYLLNEGKDPSYRDLTENTHWENYGRGLNLLCETCMSHAGYESAAILGANGSLADTWKMLTWQLSGGLGEKREGARKA